MGFPSHSPAWRGSRRTRIVPWKSARKRPSLPEPEFAAKNDLASAAHATLWTFQRPLIGIWFTAPDASGRILMRLVVPSSAR